MDILKILMGLRLIKPEKVVEKVISDPNKTPSEALEELGYEISSENERVSLNFVGKIGDYILDTVRSKKADVNLYSVNGQESQEYSRFLHLFFHANDIEANPGRIKKLNCELEGLEEDVIKNKHNIFVDSYFRPECIQAIGKNITGLDQMLSALYTAPLPDPKVYDIKTKRYIPDK